MIDFIRKSSVMAFSIITVIFTFVPETFFEKHEWIAKNIFQQSKFFVCLDTQEANIIISRLVCLFFFFFVITLL